MSRPTPSGSRTRRAPATRWPVACWPGGCCGVVIALCFGTRCRSASTARRSRSPRSVREPLRARADLSRRRVKALLDWAGTARRDLPWRRTRDPWAVLVSELMLQQTQVARVIPRYQAFLERFPTPAACAAAPAAEVIRRWAGLGYNRRALHLHA